MNAQIITECPSCHSRFRVTEGQLLMAQGQVRCGACLQVFDARTEAHRLERRLQQTRKTVQPKPRPPEPVPIRTDQLNEYLGAAAQYRSSAEPKPEPEKPQSNEAPAEGTRRAPPEQQEPEQQEPEQQSRAPRQEPEASEQTFDQPVVAEDSIPHLYAEPILLEISRERNDPYTVTGWSLASLLAVLILAGQYLWFERGTLARHAEFRPFYSLACESLPCELNRSAFTQITNRRMVVRPHPAFADALRVDIQLSNDAAFAQPYPALGLSFTNVRGELIARRIFQPRDYLDTEQPNADRMPARTPVELQLEITDPGPEAVGYSLELLPSG